MTSAPLTVYGVDSMAGELRHVAMRRPGAILDCDHERWHYANPIDGSAMHMRHTHRPPLHPERACHGAVRLPD